MTKKHDEFDLGWFIDIRYTTWGVLDATYGAGGQGSFAFFLLNGACFEL